MRDLNERHVTLKTSIGPAVRVGSLTVEPVARSLALRCSRGALVRTWPAAVLVSEEGRTSRVRIRNVTRWAQAALGLMAILGAYRLLTQRKGRKEASR